MHVALLLMLVALFVLAARVREWTDLAAFTVALPVFVGIHTFVAMLQEAFPVNHYAEVAVCVLAVLWLAQRPPRWFVAPLICLLLVLALSVIESGAMVWVAVVACAVLAWGMSGGGKDTPPLDLPAPSPSSAVALPAPTHVAAIKPTPKPPATRANRVCSRAINSTAAPTCSRLS